MNNLSNFNLREEGTIILLRLNRISFQPALEISRCYYFHSKDTPD